MARPGYRNSSANPNPSDALAPKRPPRGGSGIGKPADPLVALADAQEVANLLEARRLVIDSSTFADAVDRAALDRILAERLGISRRRG